MKHAGNSYNTLKMNNFFIILVGLLSLIFFSCSNDLDNSRNPSSGPTIDSSLYNLAEEEYWNLVTLFIDDPIRMKDLQKNMEEIRFVWHDVFDISTTVTQLVIARSRFIDIIDSAYNGIDIKNKKLLNLHRNLTLQTLTSEAELKNNVLKLSLVYADIMEQHMRSLSHNLAFDSIDFVIHESESHFHVVPVFKSYTKYIGYIVNNTDTFFCSSDSVYFEKKKYSESINLKVFGYEPNRGKYESSIEINYKMQAANN